MQIDRSGRSGTREGKQPLKLGEQIASLGRTLERFEVSVFPFWLLGKLDSLRTEQTALIAKYTMHENQRAGGIAEDVRDASARPTSP